VDDDDAVRRVMARALRGAGHVVVEAAGVASALERARQHVGSLQVLCVDGVLPDGSGREVIEGVRALYPELRVLVCSGHLEEHILRDRVGTGTYAFLAKPFLLAELVKRIAAIMLEPPS
jgi:DNA-binding NtrC family response regulator